MTTENISLEPSQPWTAALRRRWGQWTALLVALIAAGWVLSHALTGVGGTRVANPAAPAHLKSLTWGGLSVDHFWVPLFYAVTAAVMLLMVALMVRHFRRAGTQHPALPVFIVLFAQILLDPLYNWAMYCNYYPNLLHWPVNWSIMNVAPTVEPLWIVMGAYQVFFLGPAWGAFVLYRRYLNRREGTSAWIDRHQLLSLFLVSWVIGSVADILMEQWMLNMYIYKYTQIAGPAMTLGHGRLQIAEIIWIGFLIAVCAICLYRDDRGQTIGERIAQSSSWLRGHRVGAAGVTMMIVTVALALYGGYWATLRLTGNATHIAPGNWPYAAARTYDPNGRLKAAGVGGPYYFSGTWCTGSHCGRG
jgi:Spirocyclase AveC-like